MDIRNLIQQNNITDYNTLKAILESSQFNLKIKEDIQLPDLFLIYSQESSNFNLKLVNECNGLIMNKNTLQIVCYTFDKCSDAPLQSMQSINLDNLYYENAYEGTLVRLYYYENKWMLATKKCMDASKSKWISDKNFSELFNECVQYYDFLDKLNTSYCYSFIIMHPENKIVVNYTVPNVVHISTRDLTTLYEVDVDIGIQKSERVKVPREYLNDFIAKIETEQLLTHEGYMLIDLTFNRYKYKNNYYSEVRNLWGNTNNRFYRYLEMRKDVNVLQQYINFYPQDLEKFRKYEEDITVLANSILNVYLDKHVYKKSDAKIPFFFAKVIYKLHGDFYKDKVRTDCNKVMMTLLELDPKQICFMFTNLTKQKNATETEAVMDTNVIS